MTLFRTCLALLGMALLACDPNDDADDDVADTTDTETDTGGDTQDDSASCELWAGDATYPGDCNCASPGEECVQGCLIPDGMTSCEQVCAGLGESCVENSCDGGTYTPGGAGECPSVDPYAAAVAHGCSEPIAASDVGVSCCCTR
jgi:hypothetical protein